MYTYKDWWADEWTFKPEAQLEILLYCTVLPMKVRIIEISGTLIVFPNLLEYIYWPLIKDSKTSIGPKNEAPLGDVSKFFAPPPSGVVQSLLPPFGSCPKFSASPFRELSKICRAPFLRCPISFVLQVISRPPAELINNEASLRELP